MVALFGDIPDSSSDHLVMYLHCLALLVQVLCPVMTTNDVIYTQLRKTRAWAGTLLLKLNLLPFSNVLLAYNKKDRHSSNPHAHTGHFNLFNVFDDGSD